VIPDSSGTGIRQGFEHRNVCPFYAQRFEMVELNSSFYAIPEQCLVEKWNRITPSGFVFNVKLHELFSRHYCERKMVPPDLQRLAKATAKNRVIRTPEIEAAMAEKFIEAMHPLEQRANWACSCCNFRRHSDRESMGSMNWTRCSIDSRRELLPLNSGIELGGSKSA
jgi:uncharacterized protein YecE (DUF72 family)